MTVASEPRRSHVGVASVTVVTMITMAAMVIVMGASCTGGARAQADEWTLVVLGIAQDGGVPHLRTLTPDRPIELASDLRVTPFIVPHRDEFSDTVGYRIDGPRASALYLPDIDHWDRWDRDIREVVGGVDLAFLDGTFASADEVPGRSIEQISHPLIPDTRARLHDSAAEVWFIHLNHTNVELDDAADVAREGMEFEL